MLFRSDHSALLQDHLRNESLERVEHHHVGLVAGSELTEVEEVVVHRREVTGGAERIDHFLAGADGQTVVRILDQQGAPDGSDNGKRVAALLLEELRR